MSTPVYPPPGKDPTGYPGPIPPAPDPCVKKPVEQLVEPVAEEAEKEAE